ncbi:mitochondrion organization and biogenesis-related protein [Phaffia rhodozyma]|uniref:Mitochondrial distribution and morphology protein 34 n=1 Tax=Phaffia rhodozyma TaxID=264483 RepID=A0A0F7SPP7_PHARH|nr:mitochondrion organization and biogenesis-related protein [Phaffia rhodozyma]
MSFNFNWEHAFSPAFHESAKSVLETALNKGNTPALIVGKIEVRELHMGTIPPTLTLLEIGDLQKDRFRGIFRLGYAGDSHIVVGCRVQANPLSPSPSPLPTSTTPLAAHRPLLVPMALRLSSLKLRAIVVLVVSKQKGITLVFKNDPLESLQVSSTFDSIQVLKGFIQKEIEGALREMFREDLPGIIHTLSQKWFAPEEPSAGGQSRMPFHSNLESGSIPRDFSASSSTSSGDVSSCAPASAYYPSSSSSVSSPPTSPPSSHSVFTDRSLFSDPHLQASSSTSAYTPPLSPTESHATFPDLEEYDPTYGFRSKHSVLPSSSTSTPTAATNSIRSGAEGEPKAGLRTMDDSNSTPTSAGPQGYRPRSRPHLGPGLGLLGFMDPEAGITGGPSTSSGSGSAESDFGFSGQTITTSTSSLYSNFHQARRLPGRERAESNAATFRPKHVQRMSLPAIFSPVVSPSKSTATRSGYPQKSTAPRGAENHQSHHGKQSGLQPQTGRSRAYHFSESTNPSGSYDNRSTPPLSQSTTPSRTSPLISTPLGSPPLSTDGSRPSSLSSSSSAYMPAYRSRTHPSTPSAHTDSMYSRPSVARSTINTHRPSSSIAATELSSDRSSSSPRGLPETLDHLSLLSLSNQTLSPYTRELAHVAVRSQPPSQRLLDDPAGGYPSPAGYFPGAGMGTRKATRRKLHRFTTSPAVPTVSKPDPSVPLHGRATSPKQPFDPSPVAAGQRPGIGVHRESYGFPSIDQSGLDVSSGPVLSDRPTPRSGGKAMGEGRRDSGVPVPVGWRDGFTGPFAGKAGFVM